MCAGVYACMRIFEHNLCLHDFVLGDFPLFYVSACRVSPRVYLVTIESIKY